MDAILGPGDGPPKSAAFRTADIAGIDTLLHVADNLYENLPDDPQRELFSMPDFVREMVKRGWLGDKTGQGFFKKVARRRTASPRILVIDPATMEYRPQERCTSPRSSAVKDNADVRGPRTHDGQCHRTAPASSPGRLTADTLLYCAAVAAEIADDIVNIDNAMRWGFNWESGPFETWDGLGVRTLAERMTAEGRRFRHWCEQRAQQRHRQLLHQRAHPQLLRLHHQTPIS